MTVKIIKDCPLCGGKANLFPYDPFDGYYGNCIQHIVQCGECKLMIKRPTVEQVLESWNKRIK